MFGVVRMSKSRVGPRPLARTSTWAQTLLPRQVRSSRRGPTLAHSPNLCPAVPDFDKEVGRKWEIAPGKAKIVSRSSGSLNPVDALWPGGWGQVAREGLALLRDVTATCPQRASSWRQLGARLRLHPTNSTRHQRKRDPSHPEAPTYRDPPGSLNPDETSPFKAPTMGHGSPLIISNDHRSERPPRTCVPWVAGVKLP